MRVPVGLLLGANQRTKRVPGSSMTRDDLMLALALVAATTLPTILLLWAWRKR